MLEQKAKQLMSSLEVKRARYLTSTRAAVLLIVFPTCLVVIIYCFSILADVVNGKVNLKVSNYENRLALLKKDLPFYSRVNYISDLKSGPNFFIVRFVLIPARIVRTQKPEHKYLIADLFDTAKTPVIKGYTLKKDYGNGLFLFIRN